MQRNSSAKYSGYTSVQAAWAEFEACVRLNISVNRCLQRQVSLSSPRRFLTKFSWVHRLASSHSLSLTPSRIAIYNELMAFWSQNDVTRSRAWLELYFWKWLEKKTKLIKLVNIYYFLKRSNNIVGQYLGSIETYTKWNKIWLHTAHIKVDAGVPDDGAQGRPWNELLYRDYCANSEPTK